MLNFKIDDDDVLEIKLKGELDHNTAMLIRTDMDFILERNHYKKVIFNLSNLTFMDSTGIGVLLGRYRKIKDKNIYVGIKNSSPQIDKVLIVSGIYSIIPKI